VIAQLAARECIEIESQDGKYKVTQLKQAAGVVSKLAPEEACVLDMLFEDGPQAILHPGKGDDLNRYALAIQRELQTSLEGKYFTRHVGYIVLGILGSLVGAVWMALTAEGRDTVGVMFQTWWLFFCGTGIGAIFLWSMIPAWKLVLRGLGGLRQMLIGMGVLAVFGPVFVMLVRMLWKNVSPAFAVTLVSLILINILWMPALKRMTALGRQAVVEIEGFRIFLEKVEQDQMQRLNAAKETPMAGIEFLPYAIALEVKEAWGDHMAAAFFATTTSR
jgi:hypothetical protein